MSYDLYFTPNAPSLRHDEFAAYFSHRAHYVMQERQALYRNDDTGVYFYFEHHHPENKDAEAGESRAAHVAFNLNFLRPHFFGLEAAVEVEAFLTAFDMEINDPQREGMGNGPFTVEGFLRGWNAGNRFAYHAILSMEERPELHVYPTDGLHRAWKWNYHREALQDQAAGTALVPRLMFMNAGQRACTAVVWPDACPIYMPEADLVLLLRDEYAHQQRAAGAHEVAIVAWEQVAPWISEFPRIGSDVPFFELDYDIPPAQIVDFVANQPVALHQDVGLSCDNVHDEELVAEALPRG